MNGGWTENMVNEGMNEGVRDKGWIDGLMVD